MTAASTPSKTVNALFLILAVLCIGYYLAQGFGVRFGQSLDFMWLVLAFAFLSRFLCVRHMINTGSPSPLPSVLVKLIHIGFSIFLVSFIAIETIIVSAFSQTVPANLDYIIVLGAKVNGTTPGGALRNRIQVAYEYWHKNPETLIIASGGQGDDEGISEAECIFNELTKKGVPAKSIILEDESTSTYENMRNSVKLFAKEQPKVGIVTNNFHIYRAMKLAKATDAADFYGIKVATSLISFPHYMLREYFGIIVSFVTGKW